MVVPRRLHRKRQLRPKYGYIGILAIVLLSLSLILLLISTVLLERLDGASGNVASPANMLRKIGFQKPQKQINTYPVPQAKRPTAREKLSSILKRGHDILTHEVKNESAVIDMRELVHTLPFDNPDGGAWKQGWDVKPDMKKLTVFVVPHSHCDPGWIKTFDDYFQSQTKQILTTVVDALLKDKQRKFIWAEISYFEWWYREQTPEKQRQAKELLKNGQLEFVTGGWVQPDEANSELYAMEIQLQEGHDWIRKTFGSSFIPKYGWAIDPFGYSPTMAYLLQKYGFKGMLIQRVHYAVKKELAKRKHLEFYWRQTWDDIGLHDIFTHVMPFFSYDVPHTCGPDPAVCCQFDFKRTSCPWNKPPIPVSNRNLKERAMLLLDQYRKKAALYRSNVLLVPLGDDFRYQTPVEAEAQFANYQKIFDYINKNVPDTKLQFGTLSDYFDAVIGSFDAPILKGSFFTYSDVNQDYWSGYFTSRVSDKALDRRLERALFAASRLGADKLELQGPRRALSLFQHHDGVTGTAKDFVVTDYANKLLGAIQVTEKWVVDRVHLKYGSDLRDIGRLEPCWSSDQPRGMPQNKCLNEKTSTSIAVYNPLDTPQLCGSTVVPGRSLKVAPSPCELPGPAPASKTNLVFHKDTGLLIKPFREEWKVWHVQAGGAYLFVPGHLGSYAREDLVIEEGGYVVSTKYWNRTIVEKEVPSEFGTTSTVIEFIYEFHLTSDNQEWFVRFSSNVANDGVFHTDLNGFNFDTHKFRSDLPIQSQVFPMPTMSCIQDQKYRLSVLSEHAQGTASLQDGAVDVWLDRRLRQDDERGLGQGVRDNVPTRTRLRVVLEEDGFDTKKEFSLTRLGKRMWEEVQHPLVQLGTPNKDNSPVNPADFAQEQTSRQERREKLRQQRSAEREKAIIEENNRPLAVLDRWTKELLEGKPRGDQQQLGDPRPIRPADSDTNMEPQQNLREREISSIKYTVDNTDVPFVFMVYNRLSYLKKAIESLRQSDFPTRVPIIISHDGHVSEMVEYVESLKSEFHIIQLFHPYSCYEHQTTFPGDDPSLNIDYKGDSFGNPRSGWATCCKHHFTWMLANVFQQDYENFLFLEEDYVVAPSIYSAVISGLNVKTTVEEQDGGEFFGLGLDPTRADTVYTSYFYPLWYSDPFTSGPMVLGRTMWDKIKKVATQYCTYDDYNWDWTIVALQNQQLLPRAVLMPSLVLAKHIGSKGMHTDNIESYGDVFPDATSREESLDTQFASHKFVGDLEPWEKIDHEYGFGGWGHPRDHEHCLQVLQAK